MPDGELCRRVQFEEPSSPPAEPPFVPDNTYLLRIIYEKLTAIHDIQKAYLGDDTPKLKPYKILSLDLTTARDNSKELGLSGKINQLTVITLGGGSLSVRLNNSNNDLIPLYASSPKIEGIPITSLYWVNSAQSGLTATIMVAWVD